MPGKTQAGGSAYQGQKSPVWRQLPTFLLYLRSAQVKNHPVSFQSSLLYNLREFISGTYKLFPLQFLSSIITALSSLRMT